MSFDDRGEPSLAGRLPLDLLVVTLVSIAAVALAFAPVGGMAQMLLGGAFIIFCPGYALVSVLLPQRTSHIPDSLSTLSYRRSDPVQISSLERVVWSLAVSVILVPFVGFFLHYTQWGIQPPAMILGVGVLTVALAAIAVVRRLQIPADKRFAVASLALPQRLDGWMREPNNPAQTALNVFLVVGLVVAVAGVGIAAATSTNGERYTELYVLGDDPDTGAGVADEYPQQLAFGEETTIRAGIENRESATQAYTVVAQLQRLDDSGGAEQVVERSEIDRFNVQLEPGESMEQQRTIEPRMAGEGLRVVYLLYIDTPPANPTVDNAYRSVHVWVDVGETGTEAAVTEAAETEPRTVDSGVTGLTTPGPTAGFF